MNKKIDLKFTHVRMKILTYNLPCPRRGRLSIAASLNTLLIDE